MSDSLSADACQICGRKLDQAVDPLSANCGGDCWGCVGEFEAEAGDQRALAQVRQEFEAGLRPGWAEPGST